MYIYNTHSILLLLLFFSRLVKWGAMVKTHSKQQDIPPILINLDY